MNKYDSDTFYYIVYIFGADLLKDKLEYNDGIDICFEDCKKLAIEFINSEYDNKNKGLYTCLEEFVNNKFKGGNKNE